MVQFKPWTTVVAPTQLFIFLRPCSVSTQTEILTFPVQVPSDSILYCDWYALRVTNCSTAMPQTLFFLCCRIESSHVRLTSAIIAGSLISDCGSYQKLLILKHTILISGAQLWDRAPEWLVFKWQNGTLICSYTELISIDPNLCDVQV